MKTKEELNALKAEMETVGKKLAELTDDELAEVIGGELDETICRPAFRDIPRVTTKYPGMFDGCSSLTMAPELPATTLSDENADGKNTAAWYGIENNTGAFRPGSRFWVRWLSKNERK